jgi:hypothetical protein
VMAFGYQTGPTTARATDTNRVHKMALPLKGARRGHPWPRRLLAIAVLILCLLGIDSAALYPASAVAAPAGDAEPAQVTPKPEGTLRILTWNVLEPTGWERLAAALGLDALAQARARQVNQAIQRLQADVIALQEVDADFLRVLGDDPDGPGVSAYDPNGTERAPRGAGAAVALSHRRLPVPQARQSRWAPRPVRDRFGGRA